MIADTLRLEEKNYRNIETLKQLLQASGPEAATLQELYENAVEADKGIILLYKNLCEAWAEAQNLFRKADEAIKENKEESDKYHDELNEKIDEVNNYLNALIRELQEEIDDMDLSGILNRLSMVEGDLSNLTQLLRRITNYPDTTASNNVIRITPTIQNGYTEIAKAQEYHGGDPHSYSEKSIKLPYDIIQSVASANGESDVKRSDYELYHDKSTNKYHPVYIISKTVIFTDIENHPIQTMAPFHAEIHKIEIISFDCTLKSKMSQSDLEFTTNPGKLTFIGQDSTGKKIYVNADTTLRKNEYNQQQYNISVSLIDIRDKVTSDPTNIDYPAYVKCLYRIKVADLGQEVTL